MLHNAPQKSAKGYVLPKKSGGVHRSGSGKVVHFKSANGFKPTGKFTGKHHKQ